MRQRVYDGLRPLFYTAVVQIIENQKKTNCLLFLFNVFLLITNKNGNVCYLSLVYQFDVEHCARERENLIALDYVSKIRDKLAICSLRKFHSRVSKMRARVYFLAIARASLHSYFKLNREIAPGLGGEERGLTSKFRYSRNSQFAEGTARGTSAAGRPLMR